MSKNSSVSPSTNPSINQGPILIFRNTLAAPLYPPAEDLQRRLDVVVLFTGFENTFGALRIASGLASNLNARVRLLVPEVVPYPLPIDTPPASPEFSERRLASLAEQARTTTAETRVEIYLCRDRWEALAKALQPESVVVIGAGKPWWPGWERRLAWRLRRAGHQVIFAANIRKGEPVYA